MITLHQRQRLFRVRRAAELEVKHLDPRVVHHSVARLTKTHTEISFLVVERRESNVKTAEPLKQVPPNEKKSARAVIDLAPELVFGCVWVLSPAIARTSPVIPVNAPGLLERPVGKNQLSADGTYIGRAVQRLECEPE